ncbi:hypothetical protein [Pistricoccus aurantiacus]|uniref:hypothetical protein n=1 Tax=Pistricoccus aurantiacus TaxID=1883414 RepID=UPI00363620DA
MNTQLVKRAGAAFNQGDYRTARQLYQQAAARYGQQLFSANLALCDKALQGGTSSRVVTQALSSDASADVAANRQLADTQQLLEHYFMRCQELEYRLLDR